MEQVRHLEIRQLNPSAEDAVRNLGNFLKNATFGPTDTSAVETCTDSRLQAYLRPVLALLVDGV